MFYVHSHRCHPIKGSSSKRAKGIKVYLSRSQSNEIVFFHLCCTKVINSQVCFLFLPLVVPRKHFLPIIGIAKHKLRGSEPRSIKKGPTLGLFLFIYVLSNTNFTEKTQITGVEREHSDHFTTTTATNKIAFATKKC